MYKTDESATNTLTTLSQHSDTHHSADAVTVRLKDQYTLMSANKASDACKSIGSDACKEVTE